MNFEYDKYEFAPNIDAMVKNGQPEKIRSIEIFVVY